MRGEPARDGRIRPDRGWSSRAWHDSTVRSTIPPMRLPALVLAATVAATLAATAPGQSRESLTWHTDLTAAKAVAAEKHQPLLVLFRCER
jgi:hypothetical protein